MKNSDKFKVIRTPLERGVLIEYSGNDSVVEIPDTVIVINDGAFKGCSNITEITIPYSVTKICSSAFEGCTGLTKIVIQDSIVRILDEAFKGCVNLAEISVGNGSIEIGRKAFDDCVKLEDENGFKIINNKLCSYHGKSESIVIPEGIAAIGEAAFENQTNLKKHYNS